jgi:hypothetical protein
MWKGKTSDASLLKLGYEQRFPDAVCAQTPGEQQLNPKKPQPDDAKDP